MSDKSEQTGLCDSTHLEKVGKDVYVWGCTLKVGHDGRHLCDIGFPVPTKEWA